MSFRSNRASRAASKRLDVRRRRPNRFRASFELLEDRNLLSTYIVTNTNDNGAGSLRQAIMVANTNATGTPTSPDLIQFNIPANDAGHLYYTSVANQTTSVTTATDDSTITGIDPAWAHSWWSIQPSSPLPIITDPVIIDAYTQPGASANTLSVGDNAVLRIELNGGMIPYNPLTNTDHVQGARGLEIDIGNSTIRGLVVNRFAWAGLFDGVRVSNQGDNTFIGNFVGTDVSGAVALGNGSLLSADRTDSSVFDTASAGIIIDNYLDHVGGASPSDRNVISGNHGTGVLLDLRAANTDFVQGNYIGTDASGTRALGNSDFGITSGLGFTLIGGTDPGDRNLISGNGNYGIYVVSRDTCTIQGNLIGTDASGCNAIGNVMGGVLVVGATGSTNNYVIGGCIPGARNIISGNQGDGITVVSVSGTQIQGNYIGTDVTGTQHLGNHGVGGIDVSTNSTMIGGPAPGDGNVISGNYYYEIYLTGTGPKGSIIQGNTIGTDFTGEHGISPNQAYGGIAINGSGNTIGADGDGICDANEGNLISGDASCITFLYKASYNVVAGNIIGADKSGTQPLQSVTTGSTGISFQAGSPGGITSNNRIGSNFDGVSDSLEANTIAFCQVGVGVDSQQGTAVGNQIRGNHIFGNSLGIGLFNNGNDNQAPPVLSSATPSGTNSMIVKGTLHSTSNSTFVIDIYSNVGPDSSGFYEGQTYLGSTTPNSVTTDANGDAAFTATVLVPPTGQSVLTATATLTAKPSNLTVTVGDTSPFSQPIQAQLQIATSTTVTASVNPSLLNQSVTFTATVSPQSGSGTPTGTVQFLIDAANYGSPVSLTSGAASITTTTLTVGPHAVKAVYSGDNLFLASTGSLTQNVQYSFNGFLPPLNQNMAFGLNRTIPIKWQLTDSNGNLITSLSAITSLEIQALDSHSNPVGSPFNPAASGNTALRNDGSQYIFNWQTKGLSAGTYQILLTLADGTVRTKTLQLSANGSGGALLVDGTNGSTTAVGALLGGDIDLYVDNSNGALTADESARIQDAATAIDSVTAAYGVTVMEVTDPTAADVTLSMNSTSAVGGYADGVLGCTTDAGQITIIAGWNFYAGANAIQIVSSQYDFETVIVHELGHALGLGHSSNSGSMMFATLNAGRANRALAVADLNVPDSDSGACGLHADLNPKNLEPNSKNQEPMSGNGAILFPLANSGTVFSGLTSTTGNNARPSLADAGLPGVAQGGIWSFVPPAMGMDHHLPFESGTGGSASLWADEVLDAIFAHEPF